MNSLHLSLKKKKKTLSLVSLGTASGDLFRFLSWVLVAYLISVFYSKCVVRVFAVIHQKNKTPPWKS